MPRERSRRGAVPGRRRDGGHRAVPDRRRARATRATPRELALPVWTPATTEAFATYGVIDDGAIAQPVALPGKVVHAVRRPRGHDGVDEPPGADRRDALPRALPVRVRRAAQRRAILAIAALRDVLDGVQDEGHADARRDGGSRSTADIEHLSQMQNYDGGFAFWDRGHPSEPYLTVYVANALAHAKAKGFAVPDGHARRARSRTCSDIEKHYPWYYAPERALGDQRVRAVHAQAAGRPRHREGPEAARRGGRRRQADDGGRRLAARRCSRSNADGGDRARGDRALRDEPRQRDRGRGELHDRATATARTCCSRAIAASTA